MTDVFKGFDEFTVFVDSDFVHIRQKDKRGSWVVIPIYLWPAVTTSVSKQMESEIFE